MKRSTTRKASLPIATGFICALGMVALATFPIISRALAAEPTTPTMTFTEKNNGHSVEAKVGDVIEVRLTSNASTGFSWSVAAQDTEALESEGEPKYVRPDKPMPGAPGKQAFRFKVKRAGETKLELHYSRPWEKEKAPAETFALTISVTEPEK